MSSKWSFVLTNKNEHWYYDGLANTNNDAQNEEAIFLEFDKEHRIVKDEDTGSIEITIESGTELFKALKKLLYLKTK